MGSYSQERRASVLSKLLPPNNGAVPQVAKEEGICAATLYNWLKSARKRGVPVPFFSLSEWGDDPMAASANNRLHASNPVPQLIELN